MFAIGLFSTVFSSSEYSHLYAGLVTYDSITEFLAFAGRATADVYNDIPKYLFTQPAYLLTKILDSSDLDFKQTFLEVAVDSLNVDMTMEALQKGAYL
jgi:hypothetical protein